MWRKFLATWLITALVLIIAANFIPGIIVRNPNAVVFAAFILGLANAILRPMLLIFTFPLTFVTFGLFVFVINSTIIWLNSLLSPAFEVAGFVPAFISAIIMAVVTSTLNSSFPKEGS